MHLPFYVAVGIVERWFGFTEAPSFPKVQSFCSICRLEAPRPSFCSAWPFICVREGGFGSCRSLQPVCLPVSQCQWTCLVFFSSSHLHLSLKSLIFISISHLLPFLLILENLISPGSIEHICLVSDVKSVWKWKSSSDHCQFHWIPPRHHPSEWCVIISYQAQWHTSTSPSNRLLYS